MTVPNTTIRNGPYYPNGVTAAFPFTFRALDKTDVQVFRVAADGSALFLSDALFNVTLTDNGGNVLFTAPPAAGDPLYVSLDPTFAQEISFENEGAFLPEVLTEALDRGAQRSLWLRGQLGRAILMPPTEEGIDIPGPLARRGRYFGFDADGALQLLTGTGSASDASQVTLVLAEADARQRSVRDKFGREAVSILDFQNDDGTTPGLGGDDSTAMAKALGTGRKVRIPYGIRIKCNVVTPPSFWIEGDTTKLSMIEPFDKTKAAVKVAWDNLYWSYCRVIQNIMFINADPASTGYVARTGYGVVMGRNGPDDFENVGPYPQYSGGMVFRNVSFRDLRMGFRSGCGNIGIEFFSCNATSCYYGYYFQDNKNTVENGNTGDSYGDIMHAGNKYFYGGEIDDCDCGIYIHNVTEGFGCVVIYGTIIEYNKIGVYLYSNNIVFPVAFYDVWNEGNGQTSLSVPRPDNVVIDAWTGGVRSDLAVLPRTLIVEGDRVAVNHIGGLFTDVRMSAVNSRITVRDAQVEYRPGNGGSGHYVDDGSSKIILDGCKTDGGVGAFPNVISRGIPHMEKVGRSDDPSTGYNPTFAGSRHCHVAARNDKQYGYGQYANGGMESLSIGYTKPREFTGFTSYTPTVGTGGRIFPLVSNFDFTTADGAQYLLDNNATFNTDVAGYYVVTYDIRRVDGLDVNVFIGDLNTTQIIGWVGTNGTEWMTIAALAYLPAGRSFYPAFQPVSPGRTAFQFSAYQVRRFNTRVEAEAYIADGIYVVDNDDHYMDANVPITWRSGSLLPWKFGPNTSAATFEWSADPATAKRLDVIGFGVRWDATYPHEYSWADGAGKYKFGADTTTADMILENVTGGSGVFRVGVHINLNGKELRVSGDKVVGARGATVAAAVQSAAAPTKAEFDALVAVVNDLRDRLRVTTGHGLIAD